MKNFQKIYNSPDLDIRNSIPYWDEAYSDDDTDVYITDDSTYKGIPVLVRWAFLISMIGDATDLENLSELEWDKNLLEIKIDPLRCLPHDESFGCTVEEAINKTGLESDEDA